MIAVKGENCQSGQKSKYQITVYFQEIYFKYKDTDKLTAKEKIICFLITTQIRLQ